MSHVCYRESCGERLSIKVDYPKEQYKLSKIEPITDLILLSSLNFLLFLSISPLTIKLSTCPSRIRHTHTLKDRREVFFMPDNCF